MSTAHLIKPKIYMKTLYYTSTLIFALGLMAMIFTYLIPQNSLAGEGGRYASDCDISTYTAVVVGNQTATEVLASHGTRAWATLQLPKDSLGVATNTVSVVLGSTATLGGGLQLATSTNSLTFGLNTDLPFTGSVSAITSNGSTTMRITECRY